MHRTFERKEDCYERSRYNSWGCDRFTGDAASNPAELISRDTDIAYDAAVSRATIVMIWDKWRERSGTVVVPGHDLPMVLHGTQPRYRGKQQASIRAWFGKDIATLTELDLAVDRD